MSGSQNKPEFILAFICFQAIPRAIAIAIAIAIASAIARAIAITIARAIAIARAIVRFGLYFCHLEDSQALIDRAEHSMTEVRSVSQIASA